MKVLVTGANGFIGKNLVVRLNELTNFNVSTFLREDDISCLPSLISQVDAVVHLAGENRPENENAYTKVNVELTSEICNCIKKEFYLTGRHVPIIFTSSVQAVYDNNYGRSKLAAELVIESLARETNNPCMIFRLPGVFGKWCKPNYNSVVATFCQNISRDLPIKINDLTTNLKLVYIDDVVSEILNALETGFAGCIRVNVKTEYEISIGDLAEQIRAFGNCRSTLMTEKVGAGFIRALYATYISYLPPEKFSYGVAQYADSRGVFVEMLKTPDSGQFSFFTAPQGVKRGGHYHHTKTEKFLVIKGDALFRFRHLITNELVEIKTSGSKSEVVDTIPGWSHDITNIGSGEMVVMLWANENFDRQNPDTVVGKI